MSVLQSILAAVLFSIYLVCIVTVCMQTFRKGYFLLGIAGIFFPILWLIGAVLPTKQGSRQALDDAARLRHQIETTQ